MLLIKKIATVLGTAIITAPLAGVLYAADPPQISEAFGCKLLAGKTMADVNKAAEYYDTERAKIDSPDLQNMRSVIWEPFRGNVSVDFVWFNGPMTLNEWGRATDAYDNSKIGQAIEARFAKVADCRGSGLSVTQELSNTGKEFADDGGVVIESYRCTLHDGKTMGDSDAAIKAWKPVFEKAAKATDSASFVGRRIPMISGTGYDLYYYAVWDDATAYAKATSVFTADAGSARSDRLFSAAHKCDSALFKARIVARPAS